MIPERTPSFFLSTPHPCSYLEGEVATTLLVDPRRKLAPGQYDRLVKRGFRRSGTLIYRPHCPNCQACVPVRIPIRNFAPNRAQRRTLKRNADLVIEEHEPVLNDEHFDLYRRYQAVRHPGGSMDDPDPAKFEDFLVSSDMQTRFLDMRLNGKLVCAAVVDQLVDGLSAIYTYYDPDFQKRSLGTFAILWQIEAARARSLDWLYLGYWIENCDKMSYKTGYSPIQGYISGRWTLLNTQTGSDTNAGAGFPGSVIS